MMMNSEMNFRFKILIGDGHGDNRFDDNGRPAEVRRILDSLLEPGYEHLV